MLPSQFLALQRHIDAGQLHQAVDTAHQIIERFSSLAAYSEPLHNISVQLQLMTDALLNGYEDEQRNNFYQQLTMQLHHLAKDMQMQWYRHYEPAIVGYWAQAKTIKGDADSVRQKLEHFVARQAVGALDLPFFSGDNADGTGNATEHFQYLNKLFLRLWLSRQWKQQEEEQFVQLMLSPTIEIIDSCVMVSALTLSLIMIYDEHKTNTLRSVYYQATDENLRQRALVGWLLASPPTRQKQKEDVEPDETMRQQMLETQMQIFYCVSTEEDNRKIQKDIIPTLLKHSPIIMQDGILTERDEDDDLNDILNPQADEERMEEMEASMQKMMNMQQEGVDVFFGGFSKMKHFPFFHDMAVWFMPFTYDHPALQQLKGNDEKETQLIQSLLKRGPFCDSDKYSFAFVLRQTIRNLPGNMMEALETADLGMENPMEGEKNTPSFIRRMYLQNLYRFFQLHRDHHLFQTPLSPQAVENTAKALLVHRLTESDAAAMTSLAVFLYRRKQYEALIALVEQAATTLDAETQLFYALALQHQGQMSDSIPVLREVLQRMPDSVRGQSALARALLHEGKYQEASPLYDILHSQKPDSIAYALRLTLCLLEQQREEEALKVVYEQSFRYPDHADVQRMLGWTMLHCQRSEQAIQALQPLMSSKDKTPNDMLYMAYSLWAQNKRGEAIPLLMDYATVTAHKDNMSPRQKLEETLNMSASMLAKYRIDAVERQLIIDETVRRLTPTSPEGTDYTII